MKESIIIGISGASASGKSLLARTIIEELGSNQVAIISEDSYYKNNPHLSLEEKAHLNYDHPDAFDHTVLCQHLIELSKGQSIQCPTYDYKLHERREETHEISAHKITVLEGILIFNDPRLRELMDIMIFMDTPLDICLLRRLERDVQERKRTLDSVMVQYENFVRPMYLQFIEPSKHYADLIVPRGGRNRIAIDMIKAKIRELLT